MIQALIEEGEGQKSVHYEMGFGTRYRKIMDLKAPGHRNDDFQTALFEDIREK